MRELNHLHVELSGKNMIEASAGTGKTYAIACLYLRLLIEKELTPEQILLMRKYTMLQDTTKKYAKYNRKQVGGTHIDGTTHRMLNFEMEIASSTESRAISNPQRYFLHS